MGSKVFWEDYADAAAAAEEVPEGKTLRWLVQRYYASAAYKQLGPQTRRVRRGILDRFCAKHGDHSFAKLEARHLRDFRDAMVDTPDAANNLMKALRQVFKYAVAYDHLQVNPVVAVERLKSKNKDGIHTWTLAEVEAFEATHPVGTRARLALALLLYTCQRRADVVRMGRQHVRDGVMRVTQEKTNKRLELPVLDELRRVIDASETGDLTYLVTSFGKPYTSGGFGNWFRVQCNKAGLPQCSAHGLRKAAASRMAELGCSAHEIMSWTGHESLPEVQRYTKAASQKRLAERVRDRIENKEGAKFGGIPPTVPPNLENREGKQ